MTDDLDLVAKLSPEERAVKRFSLQTFSPNDGKYHDRTRQLAILLSPDAEWRLCASFQVSLLEARRDFGQATDADVEEANVALMNFDSLNAALLEGKLRHDQLAVIAELGRHMSPRAAALLHPGTTSYDILDTVRSYAFRKSWTDYIRPQAAAAVETLANLSEASKGIVQVGRTHLQDTSPVPLELTLSIYAARLAGRIQNADKAAQSLRGKVSGIVGTGASIDMVIGKGQSIDFEIAALAKLSLAPDYTATQIVQKEALADFAHSITTLGLVLGDFANDMRLLYSSAIKEISDSKNSARLAGSSADAGKNNPMDWENIAGKTAVITAGMQAVYSLISSDLQRDLRGSVVARYEPQNMLVELYESLQRTNRILPALTINRERMSQNLQYIRENPSEAMTAILRGAGWIHSKYGAGHDFVKTKMQEAKQRNEPLVSVAREDPEYRSLFDSLPVMQQAILSGDENGIKLYVGSAYERAQRNRAFARNVLNGQSL